MQDIVYYIAAVDPINDFFGTIEYGLKMGLRPFIVKGFRQTENYLATLEKHRNRVPLVIIADYAATWPNVDQGIFVKTKESVPMVSCIAYTADPMKEEWRRLRDKGAITAQEDIVDRTQKDSVEKVISIVKRKIDILEDSGEYRTIMGFLGYLQGTEQCDESLWNLLIEAARGTEKGKCLFSELPLLRSICEMKEAMVATSGTLSKAMMGEESTHDFLFRRLTRPGTLFSRLMAREKLNFLQRPVVEDMIRYKLVHLYRHDQDFRAVLGRLKVPKRTEGWRIVRKVCKNLLNYHTMHKE